MSSPEPETIARGVELLRAGRLVAFPTETVYGLGADAENPDAVARVFAAKGRPTDHPLIVHVASTAHLDGWTPPLSGPAARLAEVCWPGPLTLLVARGPRVIDAVTGGRPSVGLRIPAHPVATALLDAFGGGVAAPSANRFGHVSPTTAGHVRDDLGAAVDLVLDGGPCRVGVESTIVDCTVDPPQVVRAGGITPEQVSAILAGPVAAAAGPSRAPGMLDSHYAPKCVVVLAEAASEAASLLAEHRAAGRRCDLLDATGDLVATARSLYADLREADDRGIEVLVALLPPAAGLGHAIRDRLTKAGGPR